MSRKTREEQRDAEFTEYLAVRQPTLLRTAYLLTGDRHQAEDILQTSLAKLYLAWDKVHDRGAVDAYVRRIMVNENNSLWRRAWKKREWATDEVPEGAPHHDHYDDGTNDQLWAVVQTLPPKARSVVVLRYYEQMSEAEVADALGISVGTVKSQCSRALSALRERVPAELHPRYGEESTS
ncbi:SigE family RNA polymerase sigma factor [Nocardioides humilatus]|uniref:SigE family RNA polymerase sigma factor n=1 Tax=Nocardioides humilatus TaxID=2607660 RepID=A0A5B1LMI5_9ACTN|nr:SigE family RNA polymerase sigma factor [Nocardioides humilatus]KAA1421298.1 SigE family RNA polymerase sigma factor [Nocardioides humilatus]